MEMRTKQTPRVDDMIKNTRESRENEREPLDLDGYKVEEMNFDEVLILMRQGEVVLRRLEDD